MMKNINALLSIIFLIGLSISFHSHGTRFSVPSSPPDPLREGRYNYSEEERHYQAPGPNGSINTKSYYVTEPRTPLLNHARINAPAVILLHGNGYKISSLNSRAYQNLARLLATQGFYVFRMNWSSGGFKDEPEIAASAYKAAIKAVITDYPYNLNYHFSLIGHSVGGGALIKAAQDIVEYQPIAFPVTIDSMLALAPSMPDSERFNSYSLEGVDAPLLIVYGNKDDDVLGEVDSHKNIGDRFIKLSPFKYFDDVGYQKNQTSSYPDKTMIFMEEVGHAEFAKSSIVTEDKHQTALSLISAFVQLHGRKRESMRPYFEDDVKVPVAVEENVNYFVQSELSDSQVITDLENDLSDDLLLLSNDDSDEVIGQIQAQNIYIDRRGSWIADEYFIHNTHFLKSSWENTENDPPAKVIFWFDTPLDSEEFQRISFRAGQRLQSILNSGEIIRGQITLVSEHDSGNGSVQQSASRPFEIPPSKKIGVYKITLGQRFDVSKNFLTTFSFELDEFEGVDPHAIKQIEIEFEPQSGSVYLDSLLLSHQLANEDCWWWISEN